MNPDRRSVLRTLGLVSVTGLGGCFSLSNGEPAGSSRSTGTDGTTGSTPGSDAPPERTSNTETTTTTPLPDPEPRSGRTLTGLANDGTVDTLRQLGAYERWATQRPATVLTFVNGLESAGQADWFARERLTPIWERGHVPIVTWMPANTDPPEDTDPMIDRRIASGEFDDVLRAWARRLETWALGPNGERSVPRRFYFRPAHEMNGNWFPWSAAGTPTTADDYVSMWRRLHGTLAETALDETHVQWIFSPNADEIGEVGVEDYYPGDRYVDWFGLDGFNFGDVEAWSDWDTPEDIYAGMAERVRALADKPLALTEFASTSYRRNAYRPERKAQWIDAAFRLIERENVKLACWFDVDKQGTDESDWAVFGGDRGTGTYTDPQTASQYPVYGEYKNAVTADGMLPARQEYPRVLTDREFAGRF